MITFNSEDIIKYCGADSYKKGLSCAKQGSFLKTFIQADAVFGLYAGSLGIYRIVIHFKKNTPVYSWCTCPAMGSYSDECKHIAALMIMWQKSPQTFQILDSWTKLLEHKKSEEIIQLIISAASKSIETTNVLYEAITGDEVIDQEELYGYDEGY